MNILPLPPWAGPIVLLGCVVGAVGILRGLRWVGAKLDRLRAIENEIARDAERVADEDTRRLRQLARDRRLEREAADYYGAPLFRHVDDLPRALTELDGEPR